jgi:hypothetical protein
MEEKEAGLGFVRCRWYRCAQPPATVLDAFGMGTRKNQKAHPQPDLDRIKKAEEDRETLILTDTADPILSISEDERRSAKMSADQHSVAGRKSRLISRVVGLNWEKGLPHRTVRQASAT